MIKMPGTPWQSHAKFLWFETLDVSLNFQTHSCNAKGIRRPGLVLEWRIPLRIPGQNSSKCIVISSLWLSYESTFFSVFSVTPCSLGGASCQSPSRLLLLLPGTRLPLLSPALV